MRKKQFGKKKKPMSESSADICKLIENQFSNLKLRANLVPKQCYKVNLRNILSKKDWDIIRTAVYERDENECTICKRDNIPLHAHEDWIYDYEKGIQKLNKIISLCESCHENIHLGQSGNLSDDSRKRIREHWCKINDQNEEAFKKYLFNVLVLGH